MTPSDPNRARVRTITGWTAVAVVGALTLTACGSGAGSQAEVATGTVERGTISTGVAGAGTLAASESRNLGFPNGGQLTGVDVQVGDKVKAGDELATVDSFALRQLLVQQRANLAQQKAVLNRLSNSPTLSGANRTSSQAGTILNATRSQVSATGRADGVAISRARAGRSAAKDAQTAAQAALAACTVDCSALAAAVAQANAAVVTATTGVATAEQKRSVDAAAGKVAVGSAQQAVVSAQNSVNSTAADRPYTIAQQRAVVSSAESLVAVAEHNLALATLTAPFDGTITAINGTEGEFLAASTGTTAEAPGSDAAVPGTTIGTTTSTVTRAGGTQFMVISGTGPMTAVVPFQELDAAHLIKGQSVQLGVDALPELDLSGTVKSIAPSGAAMSGTMSYYVTVTLDGTDKHLKEGMSVHAAIATDERTDVLTVPNSAVHVTDGRSAVIVVDPAGNQKTVGFEAGLVGADRTEVLSGLSEGDRVVVQGAQK